MKLFLSSKTVPEPLIDAFAECVGKKLSEASVALIENAADPYPEERRGFVYAARENLSKLGVATVHVDLRDYKDNAAKLKEVLSKHDVIWVGGGNTFYLRWLMRESGFEKVLPELLDQGIIYGGESAGSIVVGPSLKVFDEADDPSKAGEVIWEGLGVTDLVVIPHWGQEKFQAALEKVKVHYETTKYPIGVITDDQAVIVDDDGWKVYPQ